MYQEGKDQESIESIQSSTIPDPGHHTRTCRSKYGCKDQESIQSSTTPNPGYQWESDKLTVRQHKREPRGQPFSSR